MVVVRLVLEHRLLPLQDVGGAIRPLKHDPHLLFPFVLAPPPPPALLSLFLASDPFFPLSLFFFFGSTRKALSFTSTLDFCLCGGD